MEQAKTVLDFWLKELTRADWYSGDAAVDEAVRSRFSATWASARAGALQNWQSMPQGILAYLVVTDQFPRNLFRNDARAFATDGKALTAAIRAIHHKLDLQVAEPERQFFYMPLMHSESLMDQDRCVRMFLTRMPETGAGNVLHARAHRAVIRRFGRFPYRNEALGRTSTAEERAFLARGGYMSVVEELQAA
ncbi:DUF924 family protein [Roseicitreum antarcticum]|uniref:Uncharacterized conserved protein, DUF924 family n=1 Tax=Roseicitreum antarcticum TaxID=564137 RepID=A0A1H2ZZM8_9RHOB|nr:DUF924 family protein [Roseicitreum antarcticum]SDX22119.1 Uncharacterized conserved protein, DUF924 family [Roseicitreum antarcticum]